MMANDTAPTREFIYALMDLAGATSIVDLGCGRGVELAELAGRAPRSVRLAGLDASSDAIDAARKAVGSDPRVELAVHDVTMGLPFGAGAFDRALSVNVLECIPDKQSFLREVHRVLVPGGRFVCAHWDWDSLLVDGDDKALVRKVVRTFADWKQEWMADADGWMGRRLWRTFQQSGLFDGSVQAHVHTSTRHEPGTYGFEHLQSLEALVRHGLVTREELESFLAAVQRLAAADQYFFGLTMNVYVGRVR